MHAGKTTITLLTMLSLVAAGTMAYAQDTKDADQTGIYNLYNVTGEKLTEIYLYESGTDKGENLIPDGLKNNKKVEVSYEGTEDTTLTLEFTTESGVTSSFETLHIEEAPIALLAADAVSGATPISFAVPQDTGNYTFVNTTGETVSELYVYPNTETEAAEETTKEMTEKATETEESTESTSEATTEETTEAVKGDNLAGEGLKDGESVDFSYTGDVDTSLVIEFATEKGGSQYFKTLHIEDVTINLLAVDDMTGATPIAFAH